MITSGVSYDGFFFFFSLFSLFVCLFSVSDIPWYIILPVEVNRIVE